jgi:hypothetical protein
MRPSISLKDYCLCCLLQGAEFIWMILPQMRMHEP